MMRPIDGDALIAAIEQMMKYQIDADDICEMIQNFQTIELERKKGEWIVVDDAYNRISGKCSVCGWEAHMYEDDVVGMDYCPNCGADMRGGQNEND